MTFIVVPHGGGDLSTRSFEISYRRLRIVGALLIFAVVAWLAMTVSWVYVAAQAARVPGLTRQLARLEAERVQVERLAEALRRLEAQYDQVRQMLGADRAQGTGSIWLPPPGGDDAAEEEGDSLTAALPNAWPLAERGYVTREHLGDIPGEHPGIDIAVEEGSYIRAAAGGVVEQAGAHEVYGQYVRLRHPNGYRTIYGHASELFVAPEDSVERHEVIALTGNTGRSSAPHLHFEVWRGGRAVDPWQLLRQPR